MLKRSLPRKHHCHLRVGLVAGLNGFKVTLGTACLQDGPDALFDPHIRPVPEGEEGIGDHHRAGESCLVLQNPGINFIFQALLLLAPFNLQDQISVGETMGIKAEETLAGRVEFVELTGFTLAEIKPKEERKLWLRGGFPRSFLASSDTDSASWREGFIRTFLERDIPQLGISIPAAAMRRFWTMLAHYHGQIWNASELGRAMGFSDKTMRSYLDILSGTFMIRQLMPWHENLSKRQVKAPKIYFRDSGILHQLLSLSDFQALTGHPRVGASWEGFALEQTLNILETRQIYFWSTYSGAELDLFFLHAGRRYGVEFKYSEAPVATKSIHSALETLNLEHLWIVYPGNTQYPVHEKITVLPIKNISDLKFSSS